MDANGKKNAREIHQCGDGWLVVVLHMVLQPAPEHAWPECLTQMIKKDCHFNQTADITLPFSSVIGPSQSNRGDVAFAGRLLQVQRTRQGVQFRFNWLGSCSSHKIQKWSPIKIA